MELINKDMALKVKKEHLNSEIHYGKNNSSYKVVLATASQEELKDLKKTGDFDHLFENEVKEK
jgi:hypothetical protein